MPYKISKVDGGYKVSHAGHTFSKHPQTHEMAERQRRAIAMSEFGHGASHHRK